MSVQLEVRSLEQRPYRDCLEEMRAMTDARANDEIPDTLLLVEHEGVYTAGRRSAFEQEEIAPGIELLQVERGGRITWHGPGQLVAYPICKLTGAGARPARVVAPARGRDDRRPWRIRARGAARPSGGPGSGRARPRSRRSVSRCGRWVTFHGAALNVTSELDVYTRVQPCGFDASVMTNLERELSPSPVPELGEVAERFAHAFEARLRAHPQ
jgi:lipoate-protein ligase B